MSNKTAPLVMALLVPFLGFDAKNVHKSRHLFAGCLCREVVI